MTDINTIIDESLRDCEELIIKLNQDQLYESGIVDIKNPGKQEKYAPSTIRQKRKAPFNKTEFITLKWSGDFHESFKVIYFADRLVVQSPDLKWSNWLEGRFPNALGLTDENIAILRDEFKEKFLRRLKNELRIA